MGRKRTPKKAVKFTPTVRTPYLYRAFDVKTFQETINTAVKAFKQFEKKTPFEAIAFSGVSGAAIAFPLSYLLKKPLMCVRKRKDDTHSSHVTEGCVNAPRYIIVDDFIASGGTIRRIKKEITETGGKLVGIYLFAMQPNDNTYNFKQLIFSDPAKCFDVWINEKLKKAKSKSFKSRRSK